MAFLDLFKSEKNWTKAEVTALMLLMVSQSLLDNEQTDDEKDIIFSTITGFCPGANLEDIINDASSLTPENCIKCLANMHTSKRTMVIAILAALGMVDGDWDDDEILMSYAMAKALNVNID